MNNSEAQELFTQAIAILDNTPPNDENFELMLAKSILVTLKAYSAGPGEILGLRGLGVENGIMLADEIIANGTRKLRIDTKALSLALSIST